MWIPEAARLRRAGAPLVFPTNGLLSVLTSGPADEQATTELRRDQFGLHRVEWDDEDSIEFHLPHRAWIHLLRDNSLAVELLVELAGGDREPRHPSFISQEWARR